MTHLAPKVQPPDSLAESNIPCLGWMGIALHGLGRNQEGDSMFEMMLRLMPHASLEVAMATPEILLHFEKVRSQILSERVVRDAPFTQSSITKPPSNEHSMSLSPQISPQKDRRKSKVVASLVIAAASVGIASGIWWWWMEPKPKSNIIEVNAK